MQFEQWKKLAYGIERGDCILFLGPDLPAECTPGMRSIPARDLSSRLIAGLRAPAGADETVNLARIAQRFLGQEDEMGLEMELTRWHEEMRDQVSSLHANLAALPFRLIVTSNHDPLMETALRQANKRPAIEFYHYRGQNKTLLPVPTVSEPLLFHLYGHISDASSIVLAETQLLDFLTALISKAPPLPADLNAALTNGKMFLFLGFGLHQWYLRILLHVLKVLRRGPPTFAVEIQSGRRGLAAGGRRPLLSRELPDRSLRHRCLRLCRGTAPALRAAALRRCGAQLPHTRRRIGHAVRQGAEDLHLPRQRRQRHGAEHS